MKALVVRQEIFPYEILYTSLVPRWLAKKHSQRLIRHAITPIDLHAIALWLHAIGMQLGWQA